MAGHVITFYSYKGGVGRSFLLANVATLLARWGYRILCIDWDLEAPGLRHYFLPWIGEERPGVLELVRGFSPKLSPSAWVRHVNRIVIQPIGAKLDFISAGLQNDHYFEHAQDIDWRALYQKSGFGAYLETVRSNWKSTYDFILVDSRTGVSDLAGICTVHLPDILVFLFSANKQSIEGAVSIAKRVIGSRGALPFDRERLLCVPILSRFASDKEYAMAAGWMRDIEQAVAPFYADW